MRRLLATAAAAFFSLAASDARGDIPRKDGKKEEDREARRQGDAVGRQSTPFFIAVNLSIVIADRSVA